MAQARAFQQGLNRAMKAEEKSNRRYASSDARSRQRGDRRGSKGTNGYDQEYPKLKPSIERKGEIKYHAANEEKMREKAAQDLDEDGWGQIGENDGKNTGQSGKTPTTSRDDNTTPQSCQSTNYTPPHKRSVQHRTLKEPTRSVRDATEGDLIAVEDEPRQTPVPPQRLMARMKLLDAYDDDGDGGVPLI